MKLFPRNPQSRIYILPTRFGFVFIAGATLMILIGASYQNNLVNLLAYFMLSLIFISMVQTHANLKDVSLAAVESEGGHEGEEIVLTISLLNRSKTTRFGLEINFKKLKPLTSYENVLPLFPQSTLKLRSSHRAGTRGRHALKRVRLSSIYPLGLFRAWRWEKTDQSYFVYPRPLGHLPLPLALHVDEPGALRKTGLGEDFRGHRKYEVGQSAHHIDWKARARGRPLLVKEFGGGQSGAYAFRWDHLAGLPTEGRLSQLALWIEQARKAKRPFALELPNAKFSLGDGIQHSIRCLEALAEYRDEV